MKWNDSHTPHTIRGKIQSNTWNNSCDTLIEGKKETTGGAVGYRERREVGKLHSLPYSPHQFNWWIQTYESRCDEFRATLRCNIHATHAYRVQGKYLCVEVGGSTILYPPNEFPSIFPLYFLNVHIRGMTFHVPYSMVSLHPSEIGYHTGT